MRGYLLDTNVISEFARPLPADPRVNAWLKSCPEEFLFVSVLTSAEIRRGIELLPTGKRRALLEDWRTQLEDSFEDRLLPITKSIADRWALLSVQSQRKGTPLALIDGLIAPTAIEYNLTLATRNTKDFAALGMQLLNPWEA